MAKSARSIASRGAAGFLVAVMLLLGSSSVACAKPLIDGTKEIRLITKTTGVGSRPILRWKPVPGAVDYRVVVQTPKGDPYWTWRGTETRVRLGGGPLDTPENTEGANLLGRKVWFVVAFDETGDAVGSSAKRTIAS